MIKQILTAVLFSFTMAACSGPQAAKPEVASKGPPAAQATSVSTFHCLSLYWSPESGAANRQVFVKFREAGTQKWRDGLPMRYNPIVNTDWDWKKWGSQTLPPNLTHYRGSIVNLKPGTAYEVALSLEGTNQTSSLKASTWSETFPIAETIKCVSSDKTLEITKSGTPEGYVLYDGTGATIDTNNKEKVAINVDANYVILRGFTIKNTTEHGINIVKGHHIVIEDCNISKWGSENVPGTGFGVDFQAGINCRRDTNLHAVVIQRCKIHHPSWNSNSWAQDHVPGKQSKHPSGPHTIFFWEPEGNNVIRYNEFWSDDKHYYNDTIAGSFNGSYRGWPGRDSDIYCNYIANCWDDGIEVEGGGQNVRIWNNYIEKTMTAIANAATSVGPLYIWQNVSGRSDWKPEHLSNGPSNQGHGPFMKMGFACDENFMTGHMYIFNNTVFQAKDDGHDALGGSSRIIKHCTTRNNIFHTRSKDTHSISTERRGTDNDFDHDLISARVPRGAEPNGIRGTPTYVKDAGFNFETKTGTFHLAPDSLGYRKGVVIPNFIESNNGKSPDMGAHQSGTPAMVVGVKANFVPPK
ncbi:MAG: right-handed parallel beta-helix repeat-containing protein [Phycisphaerales bacterium]|nr:right-handed parallel beta-helix repeat-containing protein [Phycisphaerales bacterium]